MTGIAHTTVGTQMTQAEFEAANSHDLSSFKPLPQVIVVASNAVDIAKYVATTGYIYVCDGTNDEVQIQAALDVCRAGGGGTVLLTDGQFNVAMSDHPTAGSGYQTCIAIGTNTKLQGMGRDATTIKLAASQPSGIIIFNYTPGGGTDKSITFEDFTIDGNIANQGSTVGQSGIAVWRAWGCLHNRIRVIDWKSNASPGVESFAFHTALGTNTNYTECEAINNSGNAKCGAGFEASSATNTKYSQCIAVTTQFDAGFTHSNCINTQHVNCHSYNNAVAGFNAEGSQDSIYINCIAGGEVAGDASVYPLPGGSLVGNGGNGFTCNTSIRAQYIGCVARRNGGDGIGIAGGANSSARIIGGDFSYNNYGISGQLANDVSVSGRPIITDNTVASQYIGTDSYPAIGYFTAPGIPATTVQLQNPQFFDVMVYMTAAASTVLVSINGSGVMTIPVGGTGSVRLPAGYYIDLTYASAPSWAWIIS